MRLIFKIIKRIIITAFILYIYNYFAVKYNLLIPINIISFVIVYFFDIFGLIGLILFKYLFLWGSYGGYIIN